MRVDYSGTMRSLQALGMTRGRECVLTVRLGDRPSTPGDSVRASLAVRAAAKQSQIQNVQKLTVCPLGKPFSNFSLPKN